MHKDWASVKEPHRNRKSTLLELGKVYGEPKLGYNRKRGGEAGGAKGALTVLVLCSKSGQASIL